MNPVPCVLIRRATQRGNCGALCDISSAQGWIVEIETLYDMNTTRAARAINLEGHVLAVGNPANLVVLNVRTDLEALRQHAGPSQVISADKVVDMAAMRHLAAAPT